MEAILVTSRSVNQHQVLQRQKQRKYNQHVNMVRDISSKKIPPLLGQTRQIAKQTLVYNRSKSTAKNFHTNEIGMEIRRSNMILSKKIQEINLVKKTTPVKLTHTSSHWQNKKKKQQEIKQENKRIASNLGNMRGDLAGFKKKMEQEIRQYLKLKKNARKFKITKKKSQRDPAQSERKISYNFNYEKIEQDLGINEEQQEQNIQDEKQGKKDDLKQIQNEDGKQIKPFKEQTIKDNKNIVDSKQRTI